MFGRSKDTDTYVETRRSKPSINYILASLLTLAGAVLLWLCAFSTPFIKSIYYIGLLGGDADRLGTFGYCADPSRDGVVGCVPKQVGYNYPLIPGNPVALTGSLIITAISAGLASLAFFALLFAIFRKKGGFPGFLLTFLAGLLALVSFVIALVCFVTLHRRLGRINNGPHYGPALWMHLAGTACLLLAIPLVLIGWIRQRKHRQPLRQTYVEPIRPITPRETHVAGTPYSPPSQVYREAREMSMYGTTPVAPVVATPYSPPVTAYPVAASPVATPYREAEEHTTAYQTPANQAVFGGAPVSTTRYENDGYSTGGNGLSTGYGHNNQIHPSRTYSGVITAPLAAPVQPARRY